MNGLFGGNFIISSHCIGPSSRGINLQNAIPAQKFITHSKKTPLVVGRAS
jgi:hypothetical protein